MKIIYVLHSKLNAKLKYWYLLYKNIEDNFYVKLHNLYLKYYNNNNNNNI